ncbi:MerR family transcriptional regulator [Prevotella sp. AGR2160]|uniref:MerR family transcriptional regulator n=1 Tax=Prevotella sp. AGR2160 TaxID=1280674 RepID=UPI000490CF77|nr:MerR family transcriptional regulator [Prevotella sp. AGR2160]
MALNPDKKVKLYYTIKEVAQEIGVNESTLRYWEKEFPLLRPKVLGNKVRQYSQADVDLLRQIYNLVKVRGFKLAAARKYLSTNREGVDRSAEILERLIRVREELKVLKKGLDGLV